MLTLGIATYRALNYFEQRKARQLMDAGRLRWGTLSVGPGAKEGAIGRSLAVDSYGGAVVVGWFRDTIAGFGGSSHKLKSEGAHDVFIVRFNPGKSTVDWAITAGTGSD